MNVLDWAIVFVVVSFFVVVACITRKYNRSVADFLSANRSAGKYLLGVATGVAGLGAISIVAVFEIHYKAGFAISWWQLLIDPVLMLLGALGWVIYRFRQTRAFTIAQFIEERYSKSLRLFCGVLAWVAGIINFGIFPAVGARFFIYFCGLPQSFNFLGITVSTFVAIMLSLLVFALFFTFIGGQIAVMMTDFFEGIYCYIAMAAILLTLLLMFDWSVIMEGLSYAPAGASMIDPFDTSRATDFNIWFVLIGIFMMAYVTLSWQSGIGYASGAKNAHAARMGSVLGRWRGVIVAMIVMFIPVCAYVVMHHPNYSETATMVKASLATVPSGYLREQMTVPIVMSHILPHGIMGIFAAMILAAFISTHDTYLHSWGSIFIQDVILPFRKKPFTPKQHIRLLRFSILGVAVFIFLFSLLFRQQQNIIFFFQLTGAMFTGGAGSIIIGGLYWKRGTTAAAWSAIITGSTLATGSVILHQLWPILHGTRFPVNGAYLSLTSALSAITLYVLVSLLSKREVFDMDHLLHRGKYAVKDDENKVGDKSPRKKHWFSFSKNFAWDDKVIFGALGLWIGAWTLCFCVVSLYKVLGGELPIEFWSRLWQIRIWMVLVVIIITCIWLLIGGLNDLKETIMILKTKKRNALDCGMVVNHHNLGEPGDEKILEESQNA